MAPGGVTVRFLSGLQIMAVSDTGYGSWQSRNRQLTVTLHGFRDNGLAPDTDFAATLALLFSAETLPDKSHDQTIACTSVRVSAHGMGAGQIANGVAKGIADAFAKPIARISPRTLGQGSDAASKQAKGLLPSSLSASLPSRPPRQAR